MAIGGGDENTRINITAVPKGFNEATAQLEAVMARLKAVKQSMAQVGNTQGLAQVASVFNQIGSAAAQLSSQIDKSNRSYTFTEVTLNRIATAARQASAAQEEYNKRYALGVSADKNTKAGRAKIDAYQDSMNKYNMALLGKPDNLVGLMNNLRAAKEGLKDVRIAGIATQDSIKALTNPGSGIGFGVPLSQAQQFSAMLQITRKNVDSLFSNWSNQITQLQWKGRQMIQGITLPLAGIAISAVNSWASIEKEILSIKKVTDFKGIGDDVDYSNVRKEVRATSREYAISEKGAAHAYQEIVQLGVRGAENTSEYMRNVMDLSLIGNMDTDSAFQFFRTLKALEADRPGVSMQQSLAIAREEMAKMNAISDNTSVKLQDLAQAFPEVAPVMKQMGFSASAVGASLAGMYKRGIPATEAAHGLKFALQRLVTPTKDSKAIIDQLGFSFFNSQGQMSDASAKMFELAKQFNNMTDAERAAAAPELFGSRQAARMNSYFNDVGAGAKELDQLAAGKLKWNDLTSDFLKGLIATEEIKLPGIKIDEVVNSAERYDHAVEMFKKDPLKAFERLKVTFKQIYTQLGATLAPMIINVGEKFVGFLEGLQNAPPLLQKIAMAIAAIAVAIGPLKYITAQLAATGVTLGKTAMAMVAPKMVNVMPSQAGAALAARSSGNFMYLGEKTMLNPKAGPVDRLMGKLGLFGHVSGKSRGGITAAAQHAAAQARVAALAEEIALNNALASSEINVAGSKEASTLASRKKELSRMHEMAVTEAAIAQKAQEIAAENAATASKKRGTAAILASTGARIKNTATAGATNMASIFTTGKTTGGASIIALLTQGAAKAGLWGIAIAAIVAVVVLLVLVFKNAKNAWASFTNALKPGIEALKRGFDAIKNAFSGIAEKFSSVLGQLGKGPGSGAEATGDFFAGLGSIVSAVATGIATAMEWIANAINFVMPFFEHIAYIVKNVIGFIGALFQGDFVKFIQFFLATMYSIVRPVLVVWDIVLKAIAQALSTILDMVASAVENTPDPFGWLDGVGDGIRSAQKAVEEFSDKGLVGILDEKLRGNLGGIFGGGIKAGAGEAEDDANKAGQDLGKEVGEGIGLGVGDSAGGSGQSWVKSWIDKVIGRIDKEMDKVRKSATEALKKAHEAALKVYDERIKAIEDQEKAEEKLLRTEEYISKKRDLLAKRNIDKQNYLNERAVAVYEGRYNDVRMLDLKEQSDKQSYSDDLNGIESDRAKELLKESRDLAKEQINIEKEATQKRLEIQSQMFEAWMAIITEYTPLTVGEFQSMTDQINELLVKAGASWPEHATTAMERFNDIFVNANKDVVDEFRKSGNAAVTAWMESFIGSEELKILKEMAKSGGGGGGGAAGAGAGAGATLTPEQGAYLDSLANPAANATPEQIAAFVGKGQGLGGPAEAGSKTDYKPPAKYGNIGGVDMDSIDSATQATINLIKQQIALGDMTNQNSDYFSLAMLQLQADAAAAYGGTEAIVQQYAQRASDALDAANNKGVISTNAATSAETQARVNMYDRIMAGTKNWSNNYTTLYGRTLSEVKVYIDKNGEVWDEVNGKMTNRFGETATRIKDEHGRVTDTLIANNGKIIQGTTKTYKNTEEEALKLFNNMIKQGIEPGTEAAKGYVQKINDLGFAVSQIDGKSVIVKIGLDTELFWRSQEAVTGWLKSFEGKTAVAAAFGNEVVRRPDGSMYVRYPNGTTAELATGGMYDASTNSIKKFAAGGLVKNQMNGIMANIGEAGYDEFVISTDPKYRAQSIGYLSAAAGKLGVSMASNAAARAASSSASVSYAASKGGEYGGGGGGDVYISVDTFIGEEQWFAELASKYNMKTVPRQRKIEGQQKRVVSSYNDRYRLR